jgi:hypothetical protein
VNRNFVANTNLQYDQIRIYESIGIPYNNPVLLTENEFEITTEDGTTIIVG